MHTKKPSELSLVASGSSSIEVSVSSLATGRRSHDSAMLTAVSSSSVAMRTGLPVSMHST